MATGSAAGVNELSRLFSLEPFPLKPVLDTKNVDKSYNNLRKYNEDLERYLRRLSAHLQSINANLVTYIDNTINIAISGVGSGFLTKIEKHYTYASKPSTTTTTTIDNSIDWRKYSFFVALRVRDVTGGAGADITSNILSTAADARFINGVTITASYPFVVTSNIGGSIINSKIQVSSGGVLQLVTTQTAAASTAFIDVLAAAVHLVPAEGSVGAVSI